MKLAELLNGVEVKEIIGSEHLNITGIAFNSLEVKPGNIFVCISGFKTDGHKYAADAIGRGAIAVMAEKDISELGVTCIICDNTRLALAKASANFYEHPEKKFKLIGITGTNGKTTTTYLVKSVLESLGHKVGLIGTNQNMVGTEVIPSKHTTPDSLELMQLFSHMAEKGAEYVVMEVSSHSLALDRVTACTFDVGAFTNITQDHLDFHKTMEQYLEAKGILYHISRAGVVNADDSGADYLLSTSKCGKMLTYGIDNECDLRAYDVELSEKGVDFKVKYEGESYTVELGIPGRFSVYNALTAIGCLLAAGVDMKDAVAGLKSARGVKGRIEVVETGRDFSVIIDYAHTPDGLYNVIRTIRGFCKGRIITVFGCGGDRDVTKRPKMGKIAAALSDFCVVTSDNPRTEDPEKIVADVVEGVKDGNCEYAVVTNRFEAIEFALDHAKANDVVLLAGKGHETYQILADRTIDFDEREIVHKLLNVE